MPEEVKANLEGPLSERFQLPADLEARFYNLVPGSSGTLKIFPAIFARVLVNYMKEQGHLDPFLETAEAFLQQKIRMFLKDVTDLDKVRWSGMMQETFYATVIRPHIGHLQHDLRLVFSLLEMQEESSRAHEFTLQLLEEAKESHHAELSGVIESFRKRVEELSSEATTDALTGLQNRKVLERMCASYSSEMPDEPFVYMIMDMDKFKILNDSLGHHAGDMAIKQLAGLISSQAGVRHEDVIRLGGEEFVILIRNKDGRGEKVAKTVRALVEDYVFQLQDNNHSYVEARKTISVGLCHCTGKELVDDLAYNKADRALQLAKGKQFTADGIVIPGQEDPDSRNRVWVYGRSRPELRGEGEDTYDGTQSK